ncbi:hypothetical protein [Neglectibacter timonensis]|jgi:hypothetical protein|uniref:hypothetical protein n=1 Tax=Neglectibacter timonensis TaxID=1776382 RepID=UPI0039A23AED
MAQKKGKRFPFARQEIKFPVVQNFLFQEPLSLYSKDFTAIFWKQKAYRYPFCLILRNIKVTN